MKCAACSYEYDTNWDDSSRSYITSIGDEKFIEVKGTFIIERVGNWYSNTTQISIYACPKCGTLQTPINGL